MATTISDTEELTAEQLLDHPDLVRGEMLKVEMVLNVIKGMPLKGLYEAIQYADSVGPFISPSIWMDKSINIDRNIKIVKALLDLKEKIV